jgi:replication factor C subunit 2/4
VQTLQSALASGNVSILSSILLLFLDPLFSQPLTLLPHLFSFQLPHLLFYGPPGTGKTTSALAIVRQLFGPELTKTRVLELNASDDRGIAVVRNKIKTFAANAVGHAVPGYPCPPYKVIILDEADSMTGDAQNALRRTMETYSKVTRFIFICNYVSRIIEPLASRCAKFRFKPLQGEIIGERINHICRAEGVEITPEAMTALGEVSGGDMRKTITTLQSAVRLRGTPVERQTVLDVAGAVPREAVEGLLNACRGGTFARLQQAVTDLIADGYPAQELLMQLQGAVLDDPSISESARGRILLKLAETDKGLVDGADETLQLLATAAHTQSVLMGTA